MLLSIRKTIFLTILCALLLVFSAQMNGAKADTQNDFVSISTTEELIIPGPEGTTFVFQPIVLKGSALGGERFIMGDPEGGFRSPPTAVAVGGSFKTSDGKEFVLYMGKFEVTEAQYDAIMGPPEGKEKRLQSNLPITEISWFDAVLFTNKLNTWLYTNAIKSLPSSGAFPAFVRLPTEAEWEYAARGGSAVDSATFDSGYPYDGDELAPFEWFSGPSSSYNKIQAVGTLQPNPLGLHDMFGNVSEMTQSTYYIEYYQGRGGGFVSRGGHYLKAEEDLYASLRTEEPYYLGSVKQGMRPNTKKTMGFRLLLTAPILTDRQSISEIDDAWETYRSADGAALPAALSVAPISEQEAVPASDALKRLQRIEEALKNANLYDNFKQDLAATESSLKAMAQLRKEADADSARVWVKIASERGMYLMRNLKALALTQNAPTEKLRMRAEEFDYNVKSGIRNYAEIMVELIKLPNSAVLEAFDEYALILDGFVQKEKESTEENKERRIQDLLIQRKWMETTKHHYEKYYAEKRGDTNLWLKEYSSQK